MQYFITGKPGNGKTLFSIDFIRKLAKGGRSVYYDGIELTEKGKQELKWIPFGSVEKIGNVKELEDGRLRLWPNIPDGAIVVIDEVQRYWRVRKQGSEVPKPVQAIETHRHFGLDLVLITQDPMLVDTNVRKLVWEHRHIKRIFGSESANIYTWKQKVGSLSNKDDLEDCLTAITAYPTEVYDLYKSAEVHTATKQLPWRQFGLIVFLIVMIVGGIWWVSWSWLSEEEKKVNRADGSAPAEGERVAPPQGRARRGSLVANIWDPLARQPRLASYPNSAPLFDELQHLKSQPRVAGCMRLDWIEADGKSRIDCRCSTSQGTRIEMTVRECMTLVKNGWFDPTKEDIDVKAQNIAYLNQRDAGGGIASNGRDAAASSTSTGGGLDVRPN